MNLQPLQMNLLRSLMSPPQLLKNPQLLQMNPQLLLSFQPL